MSDDEDVVTDPNLCSNCGQEPVGPCPASGNEKHWTKAGFDAAVRCTCGPIMRPQAYDPNCPIDGFVDEIEYDEDPCPTCGLRLYRDEEGDWMTEHHTVHMCTPRLISPPTKGNEP